MNNTFLSQYTHHNFISSKQAITETMADMQDQDDSKADISSLLEVNRLDYRLPPSLSVATARSSSAHPFMYPVPRHYHSSTSAS